MKNKILRNHMLGSLIGITGVVLFLYASNWNWLLMVGVFIMLWGNNIEVKATVSKILLDIKNAGAK